MLAQQKAEKGCRLRTFGMRGKGAYTDIRDQSRDMQKGRKMRPYMPFGTRLRKVYISLKNHSVPLRKVLTTQSLQAYQLSPFSAPAYYLF